MLFRIKLISDEVENFLREILIEDDATFLDLNNAILASCGYPDDQITSFYLCDEEWERKKQVTREDMSLDKEASFDEDIYVMGTTRLDELIEEEEQKMEFVFDPFSERVFYLDVTEIVPSRHLSAPEVVRSVGQAPKQIQVDEPDVLLTAKTAVPLTEEGLDDEFYGNDSYNSDEFDPEGYEVADSVG